MKMNIRAVTFLVLLFGVVLLCIPSIWGAVAPQEVENKIDHEATEPTELQVGDEKYKPEKSKTAEQQSNFEVNDSQPRGGGQGGGSGRGGGQGGSGGKGGGQRGGGGKGGGQGGGGGKGGVMNKSLKQLMMFITLV